MLERTSGRAPHFIPRDDNTPENREVNKREGEQYLRVVLEEAGGTRVIGEDLGVVPEYARPNLRSLGIAGFKIPQWEVHDGMIVPGNRYERLSVATYATHDHEPICALWDKAFEHPASDAGEQARATLEKIALFAGLGTNNQGTAVSLVRHSLGEGGSPPNQKGADWKPPLLDQLDFEKEFYPAIMEALFSCNSWIAMVMITDLLERKYRFNVPGTKANLNWTRRMQRSIAQLSSSPKERKRMQLIRGLLVKTERI
jgi:4-alpha-glucanotransferase